MARPLILKAPSTRRVVINPLARLPCWEGSMQATWFFEEDASNHINSFRVVEDVVVSLGHVNSVSHGIDGATIISQGTLQVGDRILAGKPGSYI